MLDVKLIEVAKEFRIDARGRSAEFGERKLREKARERKRYIANHLIQVVKHPVRLLGFVVSTFQPQIIDVIQQRARQNSLLQHRLCIKSALAFRNLGFLLGEQEREMNEVGRVPSERRVKLQVFRDGADPLFPADNQRNLHEMIVHDGGQVIGRVAVAFEEDGVFEVVAGNGEIPAEKVVEGEASGGHAKTNDVGIVVMEALADFGGGEMEAWTRRRRRRMRRIGFARMRRTETVIG